VRLHYGVGATAAMAIPWPTAIQVPAATAPLACAPAKRPPATVRKGIRCF
jgi:hypothetical protein